MAFLTWQPDYDTGINIMDQQHHRIVDLINQFHDAMSVGKGKEKAGTVLDALVHYTQSHFAAEEALMAQHGYPELDAHRKKHHDLLAEVQRFREQQQAGKIGINLSIATFLSNWLVQHIQGTDRKY